MNDSPDHLIALGMRTVLRDVQDYVSANTWEEWVGPVVLADNLNVYLQGLLIVAGATGDTD